MTPNSLSAKYGVVRVSAQSYQLPNPVYINCGPEGALGRPIVHLLNMVCLVCLSKSAQVKNLVYVNCGPVVALGSPIVHMLNMM